MILTAASLFYRYNSFGFYIPPQEVASYNVIPSGNVLVHPFIHLSIPQRFSDYNLRKDEQFFFETLYTTAIKYYETRVIFMKINVSCFQLFCIYDSYVL